MSTIAPPRCLHCGELAEGHAIALITAPFPYACIRALAARIAALEAAGKEAAPDSTVQPASVSNDGTTLSFPRGLFTTIRPCRHCGVLMVGGPTACLYCASKEAAGKVPQPAPEAGRCDERCVGRIIVEELPPWRRGTLHTDPGTMTAAFPCPSDVVAAAAWHCDNSGPAHHPAPVVTREELAEALRECADTLDDDVDDEGHRRCFKLNRDSALPRARALLARLDKEKSHGKT